MDLRDRNRLLNIATSIMIQSVSILFMSLKGDKVRACWNNRQDIVEYWFKTYVVVVVVVGVGLI